MAIGQTAGGAVRYRWSPLQQPAAGVGLQVSVKILAGSKLLNQLGVYVLVHLEAPVPAAILQ